jgi:methyl-accepting chemotaxis protein
MDQVVQQNAALVEQAAAAASSLQDEAGHLAQVVAIFQLTEPGARAVAKPGVARKPRLAAVPKVSAPAAAARPRPSARKTVNAPTQPDDAWEEF